MITASDIRNVNWGNKYRWYVRFIGKTPPPPFDKWIPCTDVEEGLWSSESRTQEAYLTSFRLPSGTSPLSLRITFADTENDLIMEWLREWAQKDMYNMDNSFQVPMCVGYLDEVVRQISVVRLDNKKRTIRVNNYWVYPDGSQAWEGVNGSELNTGTCEFVVAGKNQNKFTGGKATV